MTVFSRTLAVMTTISTIGLLMFLVMFLLFNASGIEALAALTALAVIYGAVYGFTSLRVIKSLWTDRSEIEKKPSRSLPYFVAFTTVAALLVMVFLDSVLYDYFQPVSIFDEVIAALGVAWGFLAIVLVLSAFMVRKLSRLVAHRMAALAVVALAGWPLMATTEWINDPEYHPDLTVVNDVFVGGENGYAIYRIPGMLIIPAGSRLSSGEVLNSDRLLAIAEARRDGALDNGVIDLVLKISDDGGRSWNEQQVVCRYEVGDARGKCGNPTPVFEQTNGIVFLAHNISGIDGMTPVMISSPDGGSSWSERIVLPYDDLIFGPGHGIQKSKAPAIGRIVVPGYQVQKGGNRALVLLSDDLGQNWRKSELLNDGDESAVAELEDGSIYLSTRQHAALGRAPAPNGRWMSTSDNGGISWLDVKKDVALYTPVCQASVLEYGQKGLLFSNPAHTKARVNMTVRLSNDQGSSWDTSVSVYPGASGYSDLGALSNGDVAVLFENGRMSYSEKITLALLPEQMLNDG